MNELLLQFIWRYRYYSSASLFTTAGESLIVKSPGILNHNQGPDFLAAHIQINQINWVGNIELHIYSSDFIKHQHHTDLRYQLIVLHVVWENDILLKDGYGNQVPTLVLANLVPKLLLNRYQFLMNSVKKLPCEGMISNINTLIWASWKERMVAERLMQKSIQLKGLLAQLRGNWDLLIWQLIAKYIGGKVNGDLFASIIQTVPYKVWKKYSADIEVLESLLMGQAGLLNKNTGDEYYMRLKKEYNYLQYKYQLDKPKKLAEFLRMRPTSFPTIRLSQLAVLMHRNPILLDFFKQGQSIKALQEFFALTATIYWNNHYVFGEASIDFPKKSGFQLQNNLIINVVVMVLYLYGNTQNNPIYKDHAVQLLISLPAELNQVLRIWQQNGIHSSSAFHSQALIHLQEYYCNKKSCLNCAVGNDILKRGVFTATS